MARLLACCKLRSSSASFYSSVCQVIVKPDESLMHKRSLLHVFPQKSVSRKEGTVPWELKKRKPHRGEVEMIDEVLLKEATSCSVDASLLRSRLSQATRDSWCFS